MNLSDLASIGNFLSGIAVVGSLVYLAVQIRQNTRNVRAQNAIAHFHMVAHVDEMAADPRFVDVMEKGMRGDTKMAQGEFLQFAYLQRTLITNLYAEWLLDRETLLHRGTYASNISLWARYVMGRPGVRAWWKNYGMQFSPEFQADFNRLIEETKPEETDLGFELWKANVAQERAAMAVPPPGT